MTPCTGCNRHLRDADLACPFCGTTRASVLGRAFPRAFGAVGGAVTAVVLAACYGTPYGDKWDDTGNANVVDEDNDGFAPGPGADDDCNDADAAVHPGATEVCDDTIDNDCDGKVDAEDEACATARK